eukprot:1161622-Pelagomonas_calceolata.AAC.25
MDLKAMPGEQVQKTQSQHFRHANTNLAICRTSAWAIQDNMLFVLYGVPITKDRIGQGYLAAPACKSSVKKERKNKLRVHIEPVTVTHSVNTGGVQTGPRRHKFLAGKLQTSSKDSGKKRKRKEGKDVT